MDLPAANPVQYTYDANGNLLSDGVWTYTSTTERRLAAIAPAGPAAASRPRIEYVYDGEGRRRVRHLFAFVVPASAGPPALPFGPDPRFLWDCWLLVSRGTTHYATIPSAQSSAPYVRGLDLSQTLHGAGGVGGLLSRSTTAGSSFVVERKSIVPVMASPETRLGEGTPIS